MNDISHQILDDMRQSSIGKVFLVGAGPGDPELLTRKAYRLLQTADVLLHDELVSPEILALTSSGTTVISVGKRHGTKKITQEEIHVLMIEHAKQGRIVVRLKGGDPMLFGRAAEELKALREAGIQAEIVPGITAALAAASSLQFSLTDRKVASHVTISTAHLSAENSPTGAKKQSTGTTHIFYMPGSSYRTLAENLLNEGISQHEPCLVVSHVSLPTETSIRTTLEALLTLPSLAAPSLVILGAVTEACISKLHHCPSANQQD